MKKSLMLVAALAATSIAGSAAALDIRVARELVVDSFYGTAFGSLGTLSFTALGREGNFCRYLGNWENPFNPNDVEICIVRELITPFAPSCVVNENQDINTLLVSGSGAEMLGGQAECRGFNLKGETSEASLVLSENRSGLTGVAILDTAGVLAVYPIVSEAGEEECPEPAEPGPQPGEAQCP